MKHKMRHKLLTEEQWAVLEREAELRLPITRNKVIAAKLGLTEIYVCRALSRLIQEKQGKVPRVTHIFSIREDS